MSRANPLSRSQRLKLIAQTPDETYKSDDRSTVWRTGDRVIKRFNQIGLAVHLKSWVRLHPAQVEARKARGLASVGLPVVPVESVFRHQGQWHVITPLMGVSLQRGIVDPATRWLRDPSIAPSLLDQAATITATLIGHSLFFRDLQVANLVRDASGTVRLIDIGSVRRSRRGERYHHAHRMLAMLIASIRIEGGTRTDGLRLLKRVLGELESGAPGSRTYSLTTDSPASAKPWKVVARRLIAIDPRVITRNPKP